MGDSGNDAKTDLVTMTRQLHLGRLGIFMVKWLIGHRSVNVFEKTWLNSLCTILLQGRLCMKKWTNYLFATFHAHFPEELIITFKYSSDRPKPLFSLSAETNSEPKVKHQNRNRNR